MSTATEEPITVEAEGVESVTFTANGQSVSVTPNELHQAAEAAQAGEYPAADNLTHEPENDAQLDSRDTSSAEPEPSPADILEEIRELEIEVSRRESKWLAAKEEAKDCKEDMDAAVNDLRRAIRKQNERLPLFDGPDVKVENVTKEQSKEAWRPTPIEALGLPDGIAKALTEAGLTTLGHVADYTRDHDGITGVKGIGPGKAETISEAMDRFWKDHPEHCQGEEPAPAEADPESSTNGQPNWRDVPIGNLALNFSTQQTLSDAGMRTLGQMADYAANNGGNLKGLEGMTKARLAHLSERFDAWLDAHPAEGTAYQRAVHYDGDLTFDVDAAQAISDEIDDFTTRITAKKGKEFAASVREKADEIMATIDDAGRVTNEQITALANMRNGLAKWVRE